MTGFVVKIIFCPLAVFAADYFLATVNYASFYQSILVGLVIAAGGHLAEVLLLTKGTLWISTVVDFILAMLVVYYSQFFLPGAYATWAGAATAAFVVAVVETLTHLYLINTAKTKKEPT